MTVHLHARLPVLVDPHLCERRRHRGFELLEKVGEGSLCVVWKAQDCRTGAIVALKELRQGRRTDGALLKGEFRALRQIAHPHVVSALALVDDGRVDGFGPFMTMEFVQGQSLDRYLAPLQGRRDLLPAFVCVAQQLIHAVMAVHRAGLVHRDIKCANVRVTPAGRVVLLDLDLCAPIHGGLPSCRAPGWVGTPRNNAPEVDRGRPHTPASDWFAVGVALWTAFSGTSPFQGDVRTLMVQKRTGRPCEDFGEATLPAGGMPDALVGVFDGLLAPRPGARLDGLGALRLLDGLSSTQTPAAPTRCQRPCDGSALERVNRSVRRQNPRLLRVVGTASETAELLAQVRRGIGRDPSVFLLHAQCDAAEQVAFRGLDGVVDQLVDLLRAVPRARLAELLPDEMAALAAAFPAFRTIPGVPLGLARTLCSPGAAALASAFRELLHRISRWRRVVLWIDRVASADVQSILLLESVFVTAPPPVLVVLTGASTDRGVCVDAMDRVLGSTLRGLTQRLELGDGAPTTL